MSTPSFAHVWSRLGAVGFPQAFVRKTVLPDWWDEAMVETQAGYETTVGLLATRLGITHASLRDPDAAPAFRDDAPVCFKLKDGTSTHEVSASQAFAVQVARLALKGVPARPAPTASALDVRRDLLADGRPWIDLGALLGWCWASGLPVLHVDCRVVRSRTMDAMAVRVDGRHAVVLSRHETSPARLLFHLAHELGHVLLGHLAADGVIADENIANRAETDGAGRDVQEDEANAFAVTLLTGSPKTVYRLGALARAETLAAKARDKGEAGHVLPASVVLLNTQYLRTTHPHIKPWGRVDKALRILEPDADAPAQINAALGAHLDWSALSDDRADFLADALLLEPDPAA